MLRRHARLLYQPVLPLGKGGQIVTGSKAHRDLAKKGATEGTVLLKNNGVLPLSYGAKICLFGLGAGDFLFGGGGSGSVYTNRKVSLAEALKSAEQEGKLEFFHPLPEFYAKAAAEFCDVGHRLHPKMADYHIWRRSNLMTHPVLPESLYQEARAFGDTAIFCHSRYSSEGDVGGDRPGGKGDFELWDEEKELLERLKQDFARVIVVLNVCGPVSTAEFAEDDRIGAVLYPLFGGATAGESLKEILFGEAYPSGHLQHTLARRLSDYPSDASFETKENYVNYTEDIFVGYRYFESFCPEKAVYPFGFGLSYTKFAVSLLEAKKEKNTVSVSVSVKNTGARVGKEVVQLYLEAPQGLLGKAKKVLAAFGKTRELKPGEEQKLALHFDLTSLASFDDLGKICKSAFLLEAGEYTVHFGTNVRDTEKAFSFSLEQNRICRRLHAYMAPKNLPARLTASGELEALPAEEPQKLQIRGYRPKGEAPQKMFSLDEAISQNRMDEFLLSLTDEDLSDLMYGHPMMNVSVTYGIGIPIRYERFDWKCVPVVPTADGPAGLRVKDDRGITPTFFPCENAIAQTWNLSLAQSLGKAVAREVKENNIGIWLAPALNIHRNPRCGRNFEYYSEDPLSAGLFASACVKGVQSQKICATVKHYCANNREHNRRYMDSRVSQRALREIYLKGFEIVIKKADPWALMTSYNPVNGVQMSANAEAIGGILRKEWHYDGVVMTDWRTLSNVEEELAAGSDVKMPEPITVFYEKADPNIDPVERVKSGAWPRPLVMDAARRVLKMMAKLD